MPMPRRKRKQMDDDWDDEDSSMDLQGEPEVAKVSLSDFYIPEKVNAFVHAYEPCLEGEPGYEQMDDARLREVFKAYVCGLGDPLNLYIEDLKLATPPFRMQISMATGEPCLFVRRKQ